MNLTFDRYFFSIAPVRLLLFAGLVLSIPAFYLVLNPTQPTLHLAGHALYGVVAILLLAYIAVRHKQLPASEVGIHDVHPPRVDALIALCAAISAWPTATNWTELEWLLRLGFCAVVFVRLVNLLARYVLPNQLTHILLLAILGLALAGGGFYWLEPQVSNYADGVWLAFTTGATVGYGDIVPSTPASRIFAVFMVLLGYTLFSVVTASIAALFVGEDEKALRKELHADMRLLRAEIAVLHTELRQLIANQHIVPFDQNSKKLL